MQRWDQGPLNLLSRDQAVVPPVLWPTAHPGKEAAGGHDMGLGWGSSSQVPPQPRHRQGMVSTGPQAPRGRDRPPVCPEPGMQWAFQECSSDRP